MVCAHPNDISRIVTLKTTGAPVRPNEYSLPMRITSCARIISVTAWRNMVDNTDIIGILFPHRTPASGGDQLIRGLWRLGAETVPLFDFPTK